MITFANYEYKTRRKTLRTKLAITALSFLLAACSALSSDGVAPTTTKGKLKACSIEEAGNMIQNGKAFTQSISVSADEISETCIKKLALEAAGLDKVANNDATSALQTLLNAAKK